MEKEWTYEENLSAPILTGDKVGTLTYRLGEKELGSIDILAGEDVRRPDIWIISKSCGRNSCCRPLRGVGMRKHQTPRNAFFGLFKI